METKKIIVLGAMAVLGAVVFMGVKNLGAAPDIPQQAAAPEVVVEEVEYVPVLALDADLDTGQRISEDMLTSIKWPAEALTPNLISLDAEPDAKADFIDALARQPLVQGETLSRSKVIMAGDSGVMAALLAPGMRAVTTRISVDTAAGGFIQPGDRVDIIMRENFTINQNNNQTGRQGSAERTTLYVAQTLFENVKVLAIDQVFTTSPERGAAIPGSTATFELSQADAELLQESEGYGDIYLTLRGANGSGYKGKSSARVVRDEGQPAPSSLKIIRNGQTSSVALQQNN